MVRALMQLITPKVMLRLVAETHPVAVEIRLVTKNRVNPNMKNKDTKA